MTQPMGIWRIEAQGEDGIPFDTLIDATAEPPMTPEAEVRGPGGCMAQSHPDNACWVFALLGAQRFEQEAHGARERDADTAIAVPLADDLQVAS